MSQLVYIFIGLTGVPVFVYGGGLAYVANPTFGFLLGFAVAAFVIGLITEKSKNQNLLNKIVALIVGLIIINIIGVTYFSFIKNIYINAEGTDYLYGIFLPYFIKDLILFIIIGILAQTVVPRVKTAIKK